MQPVTVTLRRRDSLLLGFFLLAALGLSYRLYTWQVTNAGSLDLRGTREHALQVPIDAPRGRIYDSQGKILVTNVEFDRVYAVPPDVKDPVTTASRLAPVLGMTYDRLSTLLQTKGNYITLARKVDPSVRDQVNALNLPGIGMEPDVKRIYPAGSLASQLLGFTNYNGDGNYGLEQYYNSVLTGKPGQLRAERDGLGNEIDLTHAVRIAPAPGKDLQLTIDSAIQYDAEQELAAGIQKHGAISGSIVVMDPFTGAILALANSPTYDPNQFQNTPVARFVNGAVSTPFEPGSTFKLITMATALQHGAVTPLTTVNDPGYLTEYGSTIHDWDRKWHGTVTMRYVLDHSLNVGAAFAAKQTGAPTFYAGVQAFGFGRPTGVDVQGEAGGVVYGSQMPDWRPINLATNSFGQGLTATSLQMATAVSAIANGGNLLQPYVVQQISSPNGVQTTQPKVVGHPISAATAATLTNMMEEVPIKGEATLARIPGYLVAGKTGTAQIAENGTYSPDATMASFVGFLPAQHPAVLIYILLDHPTDSPYGSETAAPMFADLGQQIMVHMGIAPTEPLPTPTPAATATAHG
ncbi:MAG TPA: penicillin-binding protein 2 [Chloroflexota bacterium]|jgi:cell division protein FtsI/penicillin-binding protein 2|nr:penicillin-binding protein 2 [Chloroflexota bacterium]